MTTYETTNIRLRVAPEQKAALEQIADERDVPLVGLLRDVIAGMTGVPDPLRRHGTRGTGLGRKTREHFGDRVAECP